MADEESHDVTILLASWSRGDKTALERLIPLLHSELKRRAELFLRRERRGHTLQPTALVNEAYLRLVDQSQLEPKNRSHFLALAAQIMKNILIDHARARNALKREGDRQRIELDAALGFGGQREVDLLDLDRALDNLARLDPRQAQVVVLRFFVGLSLEEIADHLNIAVITVRRDWEHAKMWLFRELSRSPR